LNCTDLEQISIGIRFISFIAFRVLIRVETHYELIDGVALDYCAYNILDASGM